MSTDTDLAKPLPTIPDGTRGPQGHWFRGHFYFDCMVLPILPDEVSPR